MLGINKLIHLRCESLIFSSPKRKAHALVFSSIFCFGSRDYGRVVHNNNEFFQVLWSFAFYLSRVVCAKNTFKSSTATIKVNFRILQETAKDYLCQIIHKT